MTSQYHPPSSPTNLKGKVIVLTGGALGVGASLVRLLHSAGAHVFFSDILSSPGEALEKELNASSPSNPVKFVHTDVSSYPSNLSLFETAYKAHGRIDHAIANAGLGEQGNIFDPELTLEGVREEPAKAEKVLDVNLKGVVYFARIAYVYLRQQDPNAEAAEKVDKSLTMVSSVAGFREDPGLYVYTASKHGVLGLMRSLRRCVPPHLPFRTHR
jgi:NAD(P)-dependent dehydrogenase (short-subunit alcohol dehydrogenase family)